MDFSSMTVQSVFTGIIVFVLLSIKSYYQKYSEAKGTNQASKEDIGEITKIVESIKIDLLKSTEELKAQLSFSNQHRLNIKSVEREAIIDFNRKISAVVSFINNFHYSFYNLDTFKDIVAAERDLILREYESELAFAHLDLFLSNEKLILLIRDLKLEVYKFTQKFLEYLTKIKTCYEIGSLNLKVAETNDKVELHRSVFNEAHALQIEFYNISKNDQLEVHKLLAQLRVQSKKILESTITDS